jgi:hypothetical protein
MKQILGYILRLILMVLFVRPHRWRYEMDKLKEKQN